MKKNIITISREFGSGGRSIGKAVADQLHIPYYDKELIKQVAEKTGFDPQYVENMGEYSSGRSRFSYAFSFPGPQSAMGGLSASDFLWIMQRQVILELADQGPCVIVGRCSDYILQDRSDCLHVFIYADSAYRAQRIVRLYGESEKAPEARLNDKDSRRAINYKHFTEQDWGRCHNYNLCLDSGALGTQACVALIAGLVQDGPEEPSAQEETSSPE